MHLWNFALTVYQSDDVKQHCLMLQDEYAVNVCLLLGIWWLSEANVSVSHSQINSLSASLNEWQHTKTLPIRKLRRQVKRVGEGLQRTVPPHQNETYEICQRLVGRWYRAMLDLELACERVELTQLEHCAALYWPVEQLFCKTLPTNMPSKLQYLQQNLATYLLAKDVPPKTILLLTKCFEHCRRSEF